MRVDCAIRLGDIPCDPHCGLCTLYTHTHIHPAPIPCSAAGLGSIHKYEPWELNLVFDPTALEGSTHTPPTSQLTHTPHLLEVAHGLSSLEPVLDCLGITPTPSLSLAQGKETEAFG